MSAEEAAALQAREVVIRDLGGKGAAVRVLSLVEIKAPTDAVWDTLLDFDWRKESNRAVQAIDAYRPAAGNELWIRFHVSKFGADIIYHNHYQTDRARGILNYKLDTSQTNDMVANRGSYELGPGSAPGHTRLAWTVESDFGTAVPDFVQRWMSSGATRDFMTELARRAEAQASR